MINNADGILYLKGSKFLFRNNEYNLDDFFNEQFYKYSDSVAPYYLAEELFDNIIFLNFMQNVLAIVCFIENNEVNRVEIIDSNRELKLYIIDAANIAKVPVKGGGKLPGINNLRCWVTMQATKYYFILKQMKVKWQKRTFDYSKDVCVIRTSAAKKKIKVQDNIEFLYEDTVGTGTLYSFLHKRERISLANAAYIEAWNALKRLKKFLKDWKLDYSGGIVIDFYIKRLVHTYFYGQVLKKLLALPWKGAFITGNNLDGYAIIEERVAHECGLEVICFPHGLEYGFRLPYGFTGDTFYATSKNAAKELNNLYDTKKFVFDPVIAESMFCMTGNNNNGENKVVYFSEPREPWVNIEILNQLYDKLSAVGIQLYIKHHPKDNLKDYELYKGKVLEIDDLQEAVSGNICVARKSTVLLESLYNNAKSAAILINEKDKTIFHTFPSLQDKGIRVFEDVDLLVQWIIEQGR